MTISANLLILDYWVGGWCVTYFDTRLSFPQANRWRRDFPCVQPYLFRTRRKRSARKGNKSLPGDWICHFPFVPLPKCQQWWESRGELLVRVRTHDTHQSHKVMKFDRNTTATCSSSSLSQHLALDVLKVQTADVAHWCGHKWAQWAVTYWAAHGECYIKTVFTTGQMSTEFEFELGEIWVAPYSMKHHMTIRSCWSQFSRNRPVVCMSAQLLEATRVAAPVLVASKSPLVFYPPGSCVEGDCIGVVALRMFTKAWGPHCYGQCDPGRLIDPFGAFGCAH